MPALNRVQLIGRLGKDPESRFIPSGQKVAHFSVAVSNRWKKDGEAKESTEWINVDAWGKLAQTCEQYLRKGSLVYVDGRLRTDKYEDKAGVTRYSTKVVASEMQMLDRKPSQEPVLAVEEEQAVYAA
jgi:single-strand DNA-binding protein